MGRKTQVSKDVILQTALEMLIRDGYSAINIKTLSKEIGCSTQPLVWHFDNMDGLRKALADYALSYANKKMCPSAEGAVNAFEQVGRAYIKMALNEPNLFQFVFLNGSGCYPKGNAEMLTKDADHAELIEMIANEFQISEQNAGKYLQNTIIYTHGLATFIATGMMCLSEEEIMALINQAGSNFLIQVGVPLDKAGEK
ncbi:MAG: TetR/AcrR family transcriptional regulator [Ruminococcaceae bacterium]|nr:TetR/AcrR family transcriptional regulator [Oscillospiraceae bacterium]